MNGNREGQSLDLAVTSLVHLHRPQLINETLIANHLRSQSSSAPQLRCNTDTLGKRESPASLPRRNDGLMLKPSASSCASPRSRSGCTSALGSNLCGLQPSSRPRTKLKPIKTTTTPSEVRFRCRRRPTAPLQFLQHARSQRCFRPDRDGIEYQGRYVMQKPLRIPQHR
jgi:hypothetical protein